MVNAGARGCGSEIGFRTGLGLGRKGEAGSGR